jgi:hypothetical protein
MRDDKNKKVDWEFICLFILLTKELRSFF